jgi:glycosyltransferase involved in cell wall biosynthesis
MQTPYVSIIIPTYRDWDRLSLCLDALASQTYPRDSFEVIVVNNDPETRTQEFKVPEGFQLLTELRSGSYAARNTGLRIAKGDIIGFTDSDCIPDRNWIKNAVTHFQANKGCSRIAGRVVVFPKNEKPTAAEKYDRLYSFRQQRYVKDSGTCVTANLFSYKYVFDAVGYFNDKQFSFADLLWGMEAHKAAYRIDYVDNVLVHHPARNWIELVKKEKRLGGGMGLKERGSKRVTLLRILNEYRPRLAEIKFVYRYGKQLNVLDKIVLLLMRHYLLGIRAYEKFKVELGKNPNRA